MIDLKFIEFSEIDGDSTKPLLINVSEIVSIEKDEAVDGNSTVTLRDGRTFVVEESIRTISARIRLSE